MRLLWPILLLAIAMPAAAQTSGRRPVFIIPNFHPASCGWLTDFSTERNYCANGYLTHLDRAAADPSYAFAMSEVNNLMAVMAFQPQRVQELKQRIREGRAELANAFFLEPTINLSGGEALVKMGVEGMRWQREVMGVHPRLAWMIDVTGVHEQMGQIVSGLELDGMVYTRDNPTASTLHWLQSPDGSRTLGISPGHYAEWEPIFSSTEALSEQQIKALIADAAGREARTPEGLPILILGGAGDYSQAPVRGTYPGEFLRQWRELSSRPIQFATPSAYLNAVLPSIRSGAIQLPTSLSGARHSWTSFWIDSPEVKQRYRHAEHQLQSTESLATVASLVANGRRPVRAATNGTAPVRYRYPSQSLYDAWLQMLLNMDRNTLWGAARGSVFESDRSWDVSDRFNAVEKTGAQEQSAAMRFLLGTGNAVGFYNSANWERHDPISLKLAPGRSLKGVACQRDRGGLTLCAVPLPSAGTVGMPLANLPPVMPKVIPVPAVIQNRHYAARIDPSTGALVSLKLKPSGREILSGPVAIVAETAGDYHETPGREKRKRLGDSNVTAKVTVREGPVATVVETRSRFYGGGTLVQTLRFYRESPRIDFDTELETIPGKTVVLAEFPLARDIAEVRRGIPYGFSHGAWSRPNPSLAGFTQGVQPAIRWSHYTFADGGGVALLDRGLPARELTGRTPTVLLMNAQNDYMGYPCAWIGGHGRRRFSYALLAHDGGWERARIPQEAWEFNAPPVVVQNVRASAPRTFVRTSGNVIVEAVRREAGEIELRMVECLGRRGIARIHVNLPHTRAALTDMVGGRRRALGSGPAYQFPIRPQQIVTMRLKTGTAVANVQPLRRWDSLVPHAKLAALRRYLPNCVGHPTLSEALTGTPRPTLPADASQSLTAGCAVSGSATYRGMARYSAANACDGVPETRWATDETVKQATLEVNLGNPRTIRRAYLSEAYDRVRRFELQAEQGGRWVTFARGGKIGPNREIVFPPVTARNVRLNILDSDGGPTIWEFMLFQ